MVGAINQLITVHMFTSLVLTGSGLLSDRILTFLNGITQTRDKNWDTNYIHCYKTADHVTYQTNWAMIKYVKILSTEEPSKQVSQFEHQTLNDKII